MNEEKKKLKNRSLALTQRAEEMVQDVLRDGPYGTFSASMMAALAMLHKSMFPAYLPVKDQLNRGVRGVGEIARDRVALKTETRKVEDEVLLDKKRKILEEVLGGQVIDVDGESFGVYYTHDQFKDYRQQVPLSAIIPEYKNGQWVPNQGLVEKMRKAKGLVPIITKDAPKKK